MSKTKGPNGGLRFREDGIVFAMLELISLLRELMSKGTFPLIRDKARLLFKVLVSVLTR